MSRKRVLTEQQYPQVLNLHAHGVPAREIAEVMGVSVRTVGRTIDADTAAKSKDYAALKKLADGRYPSLVRYFVNLYDIQEGYAEYVTAEKQERPPAFCVGSEANQPVPDNTATAMVSVIGALGEMSERLKDILAAINSIDNRLAAMQMTQSGLRSDIQKEATRIIEAVHIEGDIISKDQSRAIDLLGAIKMNTKKRQQWQGGD